jgi:hypothetical protein
MLPKTLGGPSVAGLEGQQKTVALQLASASCYAMKNRYRFRNVRDAMERRYHSLSHSDWVPAKALMIRAHYVWWFRWHESGDILSASHLHNIVIVAVAENEQRGCRCLLQKALTSDA